MDVAFKVLSKGVIEALHMAAEDSWEVIGAYYKPSIEKDELPTEEYLLKREL